MKKPRDQKKYKFKQLQTKQITRELFEAFQWSEKTEKFVDTILLELQTVVKEKGYVMAVFIDGSIKGYIAVASQLFGEDCEYLQIVDLQISKEYYSENLEVDLLNFAKVWALENGAKKLYVEGVGDGRENLVYTAEGFVDTDKEMLARKSMFMEEGIPWQKECKLVAGVGYYLTLGISIGMLFGLLVSQAVPFLDTSFGIFIGILFGVGVSVLLGRKNSKKQNQEE